MPDTLHELTAFDDIDFSFAPFPAVLLAISTAPPQQILSAAQDAILKVRNLGGLPSSIEDLNLLELDYAFTNLGHFMSCVGDYRDRHLTLTDWAQRPRSSDICYVVETRSPDTPGHEGDHAIAVLADSLACSINRKITPLEAATGRDRLVGQVFTVPPMSDVRWSS